MDNEMAQFCDDLLQSVHEMNLYIIYNAILYFRQLRFCQLPLFG